MHLCSQQKTNCLVNINLPFSPLLIFPEGTVIFTGVTEFWIGSTFEFAELEAAFGLCLGAIEVSVGPVDSVILKGEIHHFQS